MLLLAAEGLTPVLELIDGLFVVASAVPDFSGLSGLFTLGKVSAASCANEGVHEHIDSDVDKYIDSAPKTPSLFMAEALKQSVEDAFRPVDVPTPRLGKVPD